jgi:hypothetical protein
MGYGGKTHYTDSRNNDTIAPSGRELYHLPFSLQVDSLYVNFRIHPCINELHEMRILRGYKRQSKTTREKIKTNEMQKM